MKKWIMLILLLVPLYTQFSEDLPSRERLGKITSFEGQLGEKKKALKELSSADGTVFDKLLWNKQEQEKLLRLLSRISSRVSKACIDKLQNIAIKHADRIPKIISVPKTINVTNDLGDYASCTQNKAKRYILLEVTGLPVRVGWGWCGPVECSENEYSSLKEGLIELANADAEIKAELTQSTDLFVKQILPNMKEMKLLSNCSLDLAIMDPVQRRAQMSFFTTWFFIVLALLLAIICLNIAAPIYRMWNSKGGRKGQWGRVLGCFDFVSNIKGVFADSSKEDQDLRVFNGLRVLSILWVILGHTFYYPREGFIHRITEAINFLKDFQYVYILSAPFSVDVFFFLSGFLAAYLLLNQLKCSDGRFPIWYLYIHRVLRIMPMYVITMLIFCFIIPPLGTGPGFNRYYEKVYNNCAQYSYLHLLFINNFAPYNDDCLGYTWYLANDMQFFIITPIIVYIHYKWKSLSYFLLALLSVACTVAGFLICFKYNLSASYMNANDKYYSLYYVRPYNRLNPYLIGIVAAFLFTSYKEGQSSLFVSFSRCLKVTPLVRWLCYVVSCAGMFWLMHAIYWLNNYPESWTGWPDVLFLMLSKPLFVICLFVLIYPSMLREGGCIGRVLGSKVFIPFARTTYASYLLHPILMLFFYINKADELEYSHWGLLKLFFYFAAISLFLAILASVLFESPVVAFDREFIRGGAVLPLKPEGANEAALLGEANKTQREISLGPISQEG